MMAEAEVAPHIKVLIIMSVVLTLKQRLISAQMKKVQTDHLLVITSVNNVPEPIAVVALVILTEVL